MKWWGQTFNLGGTKFQSTYERSTRKVSVYILCIMQCKLFPWLFKEQTATAYGPDDPFESLLGCCSFMTNPSSKLPMSTVFLWLFEQQTLFRGWTLMICLFFKNGRSPQDVNHVNNNSKNKCSKRLYQKLHKKLVTQFDITTPKSRRLYA